MVEIAIFGAGRVGTAMSLEMPGVPLLGRGEDCQCRIACICWPAQAVNEFAESCPLAFKSHKISFCNGVWATEDGANEQGCCYVRAVTKGDRSKAGRKGWRVASPTAAVLLSKAGLNVVCSRSDHRTHVWGKALYIVPLALASAETGEPAKVAARTPRYTRWYDIARQAAVREIGEESVLKQEPRVRFLIERSPSGWRPSSSPEELVYFRSRLCAE